MAAATASWYLVAMPTTILIPVRSSEPYREPPTGCRVWEMPETNMDEIICTLVHTERMAIPSDPRLSITSRLIPSMFTMIMPMPRAVGAPMVSISEHLTDPLPTPMALSLPMK